MQVFYSQKCFFTFIFFHFAVFKLRHCDILYLDFNREPPANRRFFVCCILNGYLSYMRRFSSSVNALKRAIQ